MGITVGQHLCIVLLAISASQVLSTQVTFDHGGQLLGKQMQHNGVAVDLFLEIPFAKPPVGDLRFKKPQAAEAWTGVRNADSSQAKLCPQMLYSFAGAITFEGSEDCLYLDIAVPEGVEAASSKSVMVFIHGGGYLSGSKNGYMGAVLAARGDVIVVTINYRLGALGFLSEGEGTGNYGLWDQRMALMWVKDNIALFGGNPESITIFGESAGAGAVAAQTLGRYSEGLFQRAIQQSGTLYCRWGWHLSGNDIQSLVQGAKQAHGCDMEKSVYNCLSSKTPLEVINTFDMFDPSSPKPIMPTPDNDFFPEDISTESYILSKRFDQIIGFNADEGNIIVIEFGLSSDPPTDQDINDGLSLDYVTRLVRERLCTQTTPLSVGLCVDYVMDMYGLNSTDDDKERARRYTQFAGHLNFDADSLNQLKVHSEATQKTTYAYYFTEQFKPDPAFFLYPSWILNNSAEHADDLPFVFGGFYIMEGSVYEDYYGPLGSPSYSIDVSDFLGLYNATEESDKHLTDVMMTTWSNFAKSGNPNTPVALPVGTPEWQPYDTVNNKFIELNKNVQMITTPNKDQLEGIIRNLFTSRKNQIAADSAATVVYEVCDENDSEGKVKVGPGNSSPRSLSVQLSLLVLSLLSLSISTC